MCKKLLWLFTDAVEMPHQKKILLKLMVCLILTVDRNLAFIDDVKSALNSAKGYLGNFFYQSITWNVAEPLHFFVKFIKLCRLKWLKFVLKLKWTGTTNGNNDFPYKLFIIFYYRYIIILFIKILFMLK
jgi:hypothetical protein